MQLTCNDARTTDFNYTSKSVLHLEVSAVDEIRRKRRYFFDARERVLVFNALARVCAINLECTAFPLSRDLLLGS